MTTTDPSARRAQNIASVSWGDHIEWGAGDAHLSSPDEIAHSVERWVTRDQAARIHFREHDYYRRHGTPVRTARSEAFEARLGFDENAEVIRRGHEAGVPVYVYLTIFDELWLPQHWAWPWDPTGGWQSEYVRDHPDHVLVDAGGHERLWGVVDYNAPEARAFRVGVIRELLEAHDWDGVFLCTRSQSKPAAQGDQFGYNEPSLARYRAAAGAAADPRDPDADIELWRRVRGEGLTQLLRDVRALTTEARKPLAIGIPRGDVMGPPIGNLGLDWRTWLDERLVDSLIVGQLSEICPSAWVHLWPEHPVEHHLVDPVRFVGLRPLEQDLDEVFGPPATAAGVELFLSRLHDHPDPALESRLVAEHPHLTGIQYSTFRRDLAGAAAQLPWKRSLRWPDGRNAWDPDRGLVRLEVPDGAVLGVR
jgi:hypothetical protein